jgi:pimeloyl-ACP methyl ester carboxylesterase
MRSRARPIRNGQQSVLAVDAIALMDALEIDRAVVAGFDWGARTADIVAALWPERCIGRVSVSGYLIGSQGPPRFRCRRRLSCSGGTSWRLGAEGEPEYDELEERLARGPVITVPTITLEGDANGAPHPEPSAYAHKFSGSYSHRTIEGGIGHNLPQEAPEAFAKAVIDVDTR